MSMPASEIPTSDRILERLMDLHPKKIDLSLDRIEALLDKLDRPQDRLPPVVHVAGTNGKGSVIAYLHAILAAAGCDVQAYTSPHLVRFNERIRLTDGEIDDAELAALLEECESANGAKPITFFEITTAAAFLAFSREPADILLLEAGLGGRYDATNVVSEPACVALTPISLDHQQFLGETLSEIAGEKAAILKPGIAGVVAPQAPLAERVIEATAAERGAPLYRAGSEWAVELAPGGFRYRSAARSLDLPAPALLGPHQFVNAATAIACLDQLTDFGVDEAAIHYGVAQARWPARLQRLYEGPLVSMLPDDWELWLDGGHNPAAGEALAATVARWSDRPLYLVFGMLNTKDPEAFLEPLAEFATDLKAIAIAGEQNSLTADACRDAARAVGIPAKVADDTRDAIRRIAMSAGPARVLICGSLYLAGQVLAEHD